MKPVDLDELDRLHAAAVGPDDSVNPRLFDGFATQLACAWPALSAELRTRRKQVEEARRALSVIAGELRAPGTPPKPWCERDRASAAAIEELVGAALASLESGEGAVDKPCLIEKTGCPCVTIGGLKHCRDCPCGGSGIITDPEPRHE